MTFDVFASYMLAYVRYATTNKMTKSKLLPKIMEMVEQQAERLTSTGPIDYFGRDMITDARFGFVNILFSSDDKALAFASSGGVQVMLRDAA